MGPYVFWRARRDSNSRPPRITSYNVCYTKLLRFKIGPMILAMGIFYGGLSQVIVGIMEWKKGNTFGTLAFTSYGLFWLTLVGILIIPKLGIASP